MKTIFLTALAAVFMALSVSAFALSSDINETFDVKAGGTLYLDSDSGSVEIESHDQSTVKVEVQRKENDDSFEVTLSSDGRDVRIEGERERSMFNWGQSARFIIKVPQKYNLQLSTGGGSIEIENLIGEVQARTSGGSIRLGEIEGDVDVKTSGGSIRVQEVIGNIQGHTSGGSIRATLAQQPTKDCKLTTSGGSVTAYLAPGIKLDIKASTSGGRVRSDFEVDGSISKTSIRGEINGGGPELYLRTSGGSVNIKEL